MFKTLESEKKLLIIEQNAEKRGLLIAFFSAKYKCDEADSITSAVAKIREKEYSVILTPVALPDVSGINLIPFLQANSPRTVPIFISDPETVGNTVRAF